MKKLLNKSILILIAIMLATMQYQSTKHACYRSTQETVVPRIRTFTGDLTTPVIKYRVLSTWIAKQFVFAFAIKGSHVEKERLKSEVAKTPYGFKLLLDKIDYVALFSVISWWMFFWMFITMLIPIFYSRMPLYWILALFAATQSHWLPGGRDFVFPYDGPILFMITLTMLVLHKWMPYAIVAAMSVKETALAMIFTCDTWRKTAIAGVAAICTKIAIDLIVRNPIPIFTFEPTIRLEHDLPCIVKNMHMLSNPHVLMILSLLGVGCVFVDNKVRRAVAFYFCMMMFVGVISEYRIWLECLPMILWGIERKAELIGKNLLTLHDEIFCRV